MASILDDPKLLEEAYNSALNASGSAQQELDKYLESTAGRIAELNNSLQELWSTTISSDFINWAIDFGTGITNLATELGGLIPVVSSAVGLMASLAKNVGTAKCSSFLKMPTHICFLSKG